MGFVFFIFMKIKVKEIFKDFLLNYIILSKSLVANLNQIKRLYNSKQLTKIETEKYLNQLNYTLSVFTFDFLMKELQKNSQSTPKGSPKGVVIDVTEE